MGPKEAIGRRLEKCATSLACTVMILGFTLPALAFCVGCESPSPPRRAQVRLQQAPLYESGDVVVHKYGAKGVVVAYDVISLKGFGYTYEYYVRREGDTNADGANKCITWYEDEIAGLAAPPGRESQTTRGNSD